MSISPFEAIPAEVSLHVAMFQVIDDQTIECTIEDDAQAAIKTALTFDLSLLVQEAEYLERDQLYVAPLSIHYLFHDVRMTLRFLVL